MSRKGREIDDYLVDILESISEVEEFLQGLNYDDFATDKKTVNAVIRSLEVIGEGNPVMVRSIPPHQYCKRALRNQGSFFVCCQAFLR
jgi:uncharacterized protein with HEPN domain